MVATQDVHKFLANNKITMYEQDTGGTAPTDIGWVDMRDYEGIVFVLFRSVSNAGATNAATLVLGNDTAAGAGTDRTIKTVTFDDDPDAVGDYVFVEVSAEDIAEVGAAQTTPEDLRYVSLSIDPADALDEMVVAYIRYGAKHPHLDLSADSVA